MLGEAGPRGGGCHSTRWLKPIPSGSWRRFQVASSASCSGSGGITKCSGRDAVAVSDQPLDGDSCGEGGLWRWAAGDGLRDAADGEDDARPAGAELSEHSDERRRAAARLTWGEGGDAGPRSLGPGLPSEEEEEARATGAGLSEEELLQRDLELLELEGAGDAAEDEDSDIARSESNTDGSFTRSSGSGGGTNSVQSSGRASALPSSTLLLSTLLAVVAFVALGPTDLPPADADMDGLGEADDRFLCPGFCSIADERLLLCSDLLFFVAVIFSALCTGPSFLPLVAEPDFLDVEGPDPVSPALVG